MKRLVILIGVLLVVSDAKKCSEITSESEDLYIKEITNDIEVTDECLKTLIDKQWYQASISLATKAVEKDQLIDSSLKIDAQNAKKKVEKLLSQIESQGKINTISPAFQWAQSPDTVFLDIKFSHKLDYPGCLEVAEPEVSIQEDRLLFTGLCSRSNQRIKISLDLELHNKIVPESSTYNLNSAGRLQVTLKKVENEAWPKPNKGKKLNNVHTWWEMREKFKKQMNELTGETDDDEINPKKKKTKSGLEDLIDNPNVVIKDSYIDGQKIDNSKDRNDL